MILQTYKSKQCVISHYSVKDKIQAPPGTAKEIHVTYKRPLYNGLHIYISYNFEFDAAERHGMLLNHCFVKNIKRRFACWNIKMIENVIIL